METPHENCGTEPHATSRPESSKKGAKVLPCQRVPEVLLVAAILLFAFGAWANGIKWHPSKHGFSPLAVSATHLAEGQVQRFDRDTTTLLEQLKDRFRSDLGVAVRSGARMKSWAG